MGILDVRDIEDKEYNVLRIKNIERFFEIFTTNREGYVPPYAILADLESQVINENLPQRYISCSYKDFGDALFELVDVRIEGIFRIVEYEFTGGAS